MDNDQEDKTEKFERLAEKRMNEAIKKIRLVSNLSNKRNYSYEKAHVDKIVKTLENEIKDLKSKFEEEGRKGNYGFSFKKKEE